MDSHQFTVTNTLVCLIQGLQGKRVKIDMRNECFVVGRLESVDALMNCHLKNGYVKRPGQQKNSQSNFDDFYLQGKHIRYVHLPEDVSIYGAMHHALAQNKKLSTPAIIKKKNAPKRDSSEILEPIIAGEIDL